MSSTIFKNSWIEKDYNDKAFTAESESDRKLLNQYYVHFEKVNDRNSLLSQENYWSFSPLKGKDIIKDYFDDLIIYNIPSIKTHNFSNNRFYSKKFKKLIGYVMEIHDDYFNAKLYEKDNEGTYEIGEFDLIDIDKDDLDLFSVGAVFYWTFGYFALNGQVIKKSEIRFKRIASLEPEEIDNIVDNSDSLNDNIVWE